MALLAQSLHCGMPARRQRGNRDFGSRALGANGEEYLAGERSAPTLPVTMAAFEEALRALYASYNPPSFRRIGNWGAGGPYRGRRALRSGRAGPAPLATHVWRVQRGRLCQSLRLGSGASRARAS